MTDPDRAELRRILTAMALSKTPEEHERYSEELFVWTAWDVARNVVNRRPEETTAR